MPVRTLSKFLKLWCVDKTRQGTYEMGENHTRNTILCILILGGIVTAWFPQRLRTWNEVQNSILLSYLMDIYIILLPFIGFYSYIISHIIAPTKIKCFTIIDGVDRSLGIRKSSRHAIDLNCCVRKLCILITVGMLSAELAGVFVLVSYAWEIADTKWLLQILALSFFYTLHLTIIAQFIAWNVVLKKRFELLNRSLAGMIQESKRIAIYPENEESCKVAIIKIIMIHQKLSEVTEKIGNAYSFSLLLQIIVCFIMVLREIYILIYLTIFKQKADLLYLFSKMYYTCKSCLEVFVIVHYTTALCLEVRLLQFCTIYPLIIPKLIHLKVPMRKIDCINKT